MDETESQLPDPTQEELPTEPTETEEELNAQECTDRQALANKRREQLLTAERPPRTARDFLELAAYHAYLADGGFRAIAEDADISSEKAEEIRLVIAMTQTEIELSRMHSRAGELAVSIKMMELAGIQAKADLLTQMAEMEVAIFNATPSPKGRMRG